MKTKIAKAIEKTPTFVCLYFKGERHMSWATAKLAAKKFPKVKAELWMNRDLTKIEKKLSSGGRKKSTGAAAHNI